MSCMSDNNQITEALLDIRAQVTTVLKVFEKSPITHPQVATIEKIKNVYVHVKMMHTKLEALRNSTSSLSTYLNMCFDVNLDELAMFIKNNNDEDYYDSLKSAWEAYKK